AAIRVEHQALAGSIAAACSAGDEVVDLAHRGPLLAGASGRRSAFVESGARPAVGRDQWGGGEPSVTSQGRCRKHRPAAIPCPHAAAGRNARTSRRDPSASAARQVTGRRHLLRTYEEGAGFLRPPRVALAYVARA